MIDNAARFLAMEALSKAETTGSALDGTVKKSDIVTLTQAEYDALTEKTADFYFIKEDGVSS